jgi:hypothetical protein
MTTTVTLFNDSWSPLTGRAPRGSAPSLRVCLG